ncbi:hypothetical protein [Actinomyces sp.]|uniref:hypothetical protein n=1 Tax=Actinomyces sp. TaxID=29317 RepID=UPI00291028C8|nr:hypothetical protein [Actinomyces sp.]MDU6680112.1 hypothetical protein [Actinomyces sp.]
MNVFSQGAVLISVGKVRLGAGLASLDLNPVPEAPPGVEAIVQTVLNWLLWIAGATTMIGCVIAGIMLAVSNEWATGNEALRRVVYIVGTAIVVMVVLTLLKLVL